MDFSVSSRRRNVTDPDILVVSPTDSILTRDLLGRQNVNRFLRGFIHRNRLEHQVILGSVYLIVVQVVFTFGMVCFEFEWEGGLTNLAFEGDPLVLANPWIFKFCHFCVNPEPQTRQMDKLNSTRACAALEQRIFNRVRAIPTESASDLLLLVIVPLVVFLLASLAISKVWLCLLLILWWRILQITIVFINFLDLHRRIRIQPRLIIVFSAISTWAAIIILQEVQVLGHFNRSRLLESAMSWLPWFFGPFDRCFFWWRNFFWLLVNLDGAIILSQIVSIYHDWSRGSGLLSISY